MSKKKSKNKKIEKNEKLTIVEEKIEETVIDDVAPIIPRYLTELNEKYNNIQNDYNIKIEQNRVLKEYLDSKHNIYENIKNRVFNIQESTFNYSKKIVNQEIIPLYVFFDFENNTYTTNLINEMPECYLGDGGNIHVCKENGLYVNKEHYSSSRLFLADKNKVDSNLNYIASFEKILDNIVSKINLDEKYTYFCMLPESIDMFNTKIRRCLNTSKGSIISIPKSIAITYCVLNELRIGDRYCVIDMDGLHPVVTQLYIGRDDEGNKIILREGFINSKDIKFDYISFAKEYLELYCKKYYIDLLDNEIENIVYNKKLNKVFINKESTVIFRKEGKLNINFDDSIYKQCLDKYTTSGCSFTKCNRIYVVSSFNNLFKGNEVIQLDNSASFKGLELIRNKLLDDENAIIWKERLPKVSLEVIDDLTGRFKTINLIEEDNEGQNIRLSVNEEIELPFKGTITLQKGKNEYYLPLEREIYSDDINGAKEAHFYDKSFPLDRDIPVEIIVKYNYMSDSPIKLYARPKTKISEFQELPNTWVDPHEIAIYNGPLYDGHSKDIYEIYDYPFYDVSRSIGGLFNGYLDLDVSKYYRNIAGDFYPRCMKSIDSQYRRIRSVFDSYNYNSSNFINVYRNQHMSSYYDICLEALNYEDNNEYYEPGHLKAFKKCLNRILSDTIVASWYYEKEDDTINQIYEIMSNCKQIKVLTRLSRCIQNNQDDPYNIFEKLTSELCKFLENNKEGNINSKNSKIGDYLRTLSGNCWFNKNWVYQFYDTKDGKKIVDLLLHQIYNYLKNESFFNDKKYRDIMEFLVCISMLKNVDKTILNPNDVFTKELLVQIKKSYEIVLNCIDSNNLVSRLEVDDSSQGSLFGYKNYIYMLIITLSGEGQVNLVGYHDD